MAKDIITVTDKAVEFIQSVIAKGKAEEKELIGLRISVKTGGCSGSEYEFNYAETEQPMDELVNAGGVKVFIDPAATLKVLGSELDYEEDKFSSGLVFRNPNELGRCGCGKSVQL